MELQKKEGIGETLIGKLKAKSLDAQGNKMLMQAS